MTISDIPSLVDPIRLLREAREMEEQLTDLGVDVVIDPFSGYVAGEYKKLRRKAVDSQGSA
jgi:hypothetical protein